MTDINNKYMKMYWKICNIAKDRTLPEGTYIERHHVYPKSIYGANKDLVKLTAKEHYMVHLLLWKGLRTEYGKSDIKSRKMASAFCMMNMKSKYHNNCRYISKDFALARVANYEANKNKIVSEETKKKISSKAKGRKHSDESNRKLSERMKGNSYSLGNHHTEETKKQMSLSRKGRITTDESKKKLSVSHKEYWENMDEGSYQNRCENVTGEKNGMFGKHLSEESLKKIKVKQETWYANGGKEILQKIQKDKWENMSEEDHQKHRDRSSGKNNGMYGKNLYDIWKDKYGKDIADEKMEKFKNDVSKIRSNKIYVYDTDKNLIDIFENKIKASEKYCLSETSIQDNCRSNKIKETFYKGFLFSYKDIYKEEGSLS